MSRSRPGGSETAFGAPEDVLEAALDAVVTVDADGAILYVNRAAEEMFAVEREAVIGRVAADTILVENQRPGLLDRLREGHDPAFLGRRREMRGQRGDGAQFPIELTVMVSSDQPRQYTGFIRDLSQLKQQESERARMESILTKAERIVGMGSFELNLTTEELTFSDGLYRLYGYEPGEVEPTLDLAIGRMHSGDRDRMQAIREEVLESPHPVKAEFRIQLDDGGIRHAVVDAVPERDPRGNTEKLVGTVRDVTDQHLSERDLRAHYALTQTLSEWNSFEEGVVDLLRRLGTAMEWDMGAIWVKAPQRADLLVSRAFWSDPTADLAVFEQRSREMSFERGVGAVWKVWEEQRPYNVVDIATDQYLSEGLAREKAVERDVRSAILFPAVHDGETLAVLSFAGTEPRVLTDRLSRTLESLGQDLGRFLARRRSEIGPRKLSVRELEVLELAAEGLSAPLIAEQLMIGPATVKTHFTHIYEKLGVTDRSAAVAEGMRKGLIE